MPKRQQGPPSQGNAGATEQAEGGPAAGSPGLTWSPSTYRVKHLSGHGLGGTVASPWFGTLQQAIDYARDLQRQPFVTLVRLEASREALLPDE